MTGSGMRTETERERGETGDGTFRERKGRDREGEESDGSELEQACLSGDGRGCPGEDTKEKDEGSSWTVTIAKQAESCYSTIVD